MIVWNLGSLLLDLLLGSHKLSNIEVANKFKGQPFSFEAVGVKEEKYSHFSMEVRQLLGKLLHYDPKKRMNSEELFNSKEICEEVATDMAKLGQSLPPSKIHVPGPSKISKITPKLEQTMMKVENQFEN